MARQNLNVDAKIGGRKGKVRKRGCSSSPSSLAQNYRLKRTFLVGKRGGSTTPVPMWKMMSSDSPSLANDGALNGKKAKELSMSARKLAAILWEINGLDSPGLERGILEDKTSEVGMVGKDRPHSEKMDPSNLGSYRRRASASSQKHVQPDCNLGGAVPSSLHDCLVQVDQTQNQVRSPCRHLIGLKNHLEDVHYGLTTSKELLKVLSRVWRLQQLDSTSLSLVSALKVELERARTRLNKLIQGQNIRSETEKQVEDKKLFWKIKEQDRIHSDLTCTEGELEIERKLRQKTEKLNEKLGRELAETKASLSRATKELESEKRAREAVEEVCNELVQGVGELKRQAAEVREELENERQMLQLAEVLREERVRMKLSEAKYLFEEKNALVDKLRIELEAYLKSKTSGKQGDGSPSYEKIKELENYLTETFPPSCQSQNRENIEAVSKEREGDESADSDLHSIELNVDNISKSFQWTDALKSGSKRISMDRSKGRGKTEKPTIFSEPKSADGMAWECNTNKQEKLDVFDGMGLSEFTSHSSKKDIEDEMDRYNMIRDLRDHIVSGSRMASSQDLVSRSQKPSPPAKHISEGS